MKHLHTSVILIALSLAVLSVRAQENKGTYRFLYATNSARVAALGGLPLPFYDCDVQTAGFNPSSINPEMHNHLSLSYVDNLGDVNFGTAQYGRDFERIGSFVGTVQFHNYGKFAYSSEGGLLEGGDFTCSDYAVSLGWGRALSDRWNIGSNLKYAGLQYESYAAGAVAVDVAGMYKDESGWIFSLTARNAGMQLFNNIDNHDSRWLPFQLDLGVSKKLEHLPLTIVMYYDDIQRWNKLHKDPLDLQGNYDPLTGELKQDSKTKRFVKNLASHFVIGGELAIGKNLYLRAAYNYGRRHEMNVPSASSPTLVGFSGGFGVKIKNFRIDYSRSRMNIVKSPNYITVSLNLDGF